MSFVLPSRSIAAVVKVSPNQEKVLNYSTVVQLPASLGSSFHLFAHMVEENCAPEGGTPLAPHLQPVHLK